MEEHTEAAVPLLPPAGPGPSPAGNGGVARHLKLATQLSWAANWLLLLLKTAAFALSLSKAVLASLADSAGAAAVVRSTQGSALLPPLVMATARPPHLPSPPPVTQP